MSKEEYKSVLEPKSELILLEAKKLISNYERIVEEIAKISQVLPTQARDIKYIADTLYDSFEELRLDTTAISSFIRIYELIIRDGIQSELFDDLTDINTIFGVYIHETVRNIYASGDFGARNTPCNREIIGKLKAFFEKMTIGNLHPIEDLQALFDDLASALHKQAKLTVVNQTDREQLKLLARIIPMIEDTVKDAIIYRMENSTEREESGKPKEGYVRLHLQTSKNQLFVAIFDDGRGLDKLVKTDKLSQDIAKLSGELISESLVDVGTRVVVKIPL